jgi:hypothetical protein
MLKVKRLEVGLGKQISVSDFDLLSKVKNLNHLTAQAPITLLFVY